MEPTLQNFVIAKMKALDLNRSNFGAKCGVSYGTITNIVEGRPVGLMVISKIAQTFDTPISFFLSSRTNIHTGLSDADVDRIADAVVAKLKAIKMS